MDKEFIFNRLTFGGLLNSSLLKSFLAIMNLTLFSALPGFASGGGEHTEAPKGHRDNGALFPPKQANSALSTAPSAPQLKSPEFMATTAGDTELKWSPVENATVYHVQIATDVNFKWLVTDDHQVKDTSFKTNGLAKGKRYYWRVAAWKSDNMAATNKSYFAASAFTVE